MMRVLRVSVLYASTAGIATNSPNAVMINASPTGPATCSIMICPLPEMPTKAW